MRYRYIVPIIFLLSLSTNQIYSQHLVKDSIGRFQFVLPSGFKINENPTTPNSPMYVDDNGFSISIKFEKTQFTIEQFAMGMDEELLEASFAQALNGFQKNKIQIIKDNEKPGVLLNCNMKAKAGDSVFYMTNIIKTYYYKGDIVTIAFMGLKDIFKNYEHLYSQFFSTFTHDMTKTIEPVAYENGKAYLSGPGIEVEFPSRPTESKTNGLPVWESTDQKERITYRVLLLANNNLIGYQQNREEFLIGANKGYRSGIADEGIKITDTLMNNQPCMFWSGTSSTERGSSVYTLTTTYGNSFLVFSVMGEEKKLARALQRFVSSVRPVQPADLFSQASR